MVSRFRTGMIRPVARTAIANLWTTTLISNSGWIRPATCSLAISQPGTLSTNTSSSCHRTNDTMSASIRMLTAITAPCVFTTEQEHDMRYSMKWPEYRTQWDEMKIDPVRQREFDHLAMFAIGHRAQYITIEGDSGVPWPMVACLHRRESDADFTT